MALKTLKDAQFNGKRVVMRVDFNVPMKDGITQDTTRIQAALPSIRYILEQNAKSITLMSHLGDPKKDVKKAEEKAKKLNQNFDKEAYINAKHRMAPVASKLQELLNQEGIKSKVAFAPDCVGNSSMLDTLENGSILLLENTRFHEGETSKDETKRMELAKELAKYGEVYVNDAFGTAHRAHASTETVAHILKDRYAGFLIEKEIKAFKPFLSNPEKPFVAIIGGAKVSSKIAVLNSLMNTANTFIIGGGMSFTFLKAQGYKIGNSLVEDDQLDIARSILENAKKNNVKILLPLDHAVSAEFSDSAKREEPDGIDVADGKMALDIGQKTLNTIEEELKNAKSIIWNGPMGVFELDNFTLGTRRTGELIANSGAVTVVGGGDSVAACNKFNLSSKMTHVSTGGGASLELLEGRQLPGITILDY